MGKREVAIITFYDAYNYGAYWQTRCLKDYINNMENINCSVLKTELRKDTLIHFKQLFYYISHKIDFKKMVFEIKCYNAFQRFSKYFKPKSKYGLYDAYIFGSDELWNIKKKLNRKRKSRILWGLGLCDSVIKISYAPSINEAEINDFNKLPLFKENVSKFASLSARDSRSVEVLESLLQRKVELVVDPTLLQGYEYFKKILPIDNKESVGNYILLYAYELTKKEKQFIELFSQRKGLKIISIGNYIDFADNSILCSPEQFLQYFRNALYVFTNTFHGTMFSIIFRKNCGILDGHHQKVDEAISQFELDKFRVSNLEDLWNLDNRDLNQMWDDVYQIVEKCKEKSRDFIIKSLDLIN